MFRRFLSPGFFALTFYLAGSSVLAFAQVGTLPEPSSYGKAIEMRTDIVFRGSRYLKLDLYLPAGAREAPPVIICWYGGAFYGERLSGLAREAAYFAAHGFAAVVPDYSLGTKDGEKFCWPDAVFDAKAAVRFVRANAKDLKVDPSRIIAFGHSSGAYLAMMVGFTPNLTELEGSGVARSESSKVSAVIEVSGVSDRRRDVGLPLALLGKGYETKYDLRVAASPVIYVNPTTVPVYILHGTHDHISDVSSATLLAAALEAVHVPCELRLVDADHDPFNVAELQRMVDWLNRIVPGRRTAAH